MVDSNLRRGHKNDGLIEIENEEDQEEAVEFEDIMINGIVYRLPERGIKLDFLDKVKQYVTVRRLSVSAAYEFPSRMNERENSRKRLAEVRISEEPPKRRRLSEDVAPKASTTTSRTVEEVRASLSETDRRLIDALIELKAVERVATRSPVQVAESEALALIHKLMV